MYDVRTYVTTRYVCMMYEISVPACDVQCVCMMSVPSSYIRTYIYITTRYVLENDDHLWGEPKL